MEAGLVVVDTPGVGGLFKEHRNVTWRFAPNADAIIFVLDSVEAVLSADEISFLTDLTTKYTKRILFVQTKVDFASQELWSAWATRNKQILTSHLGFDESSLFYFPVSAKLKNAADKVSSLLMLERSGYLPLVQFLQGSLIRAKERETGRDVARKLLMVGDKIVTEKRLQIDALKDSTAAEIQKIEADRRAAIEQFSNWEQFEFKPLLQCAMNRLLSARRDAMDRVDELLNPSGRLLLEFVEQQSQKSATEIQEQAGTIQQDFMELCGERLGRIFDQYVSSYNDACKEILESREHVSLSDTMTDARSPLVDVDYRQVSSLNMSASSSFETARNMMFGGMAGATLAGAALSVAAVAFPPLAAFNVIVWLGGIYGAAEVKRIGDERRKDEAVHKLRGLLSDQISQIRRSVLRHFERKAEECSDSLQEIFKSAVMHAKADLDRRVKEITSMGALTKEQAKDFVKSLEETLRTAQSACVRLASCLEASRG